MKKKKKNSFLLSSLFLCVWFPLQRGLFTKPTMKLNVWMKRVFFLHSFSRWKWRRKSDGTRTGGSSFERSSPGKKHYFLEKKKSEKESVNNKVKKVSLKIYIYTVYTACTQCIYPFHVFPMNFINLLLKIFYRKNSPSLFFFRNFSRSAISFNSSFISFLFNFTIFTIGFIFLVILK